MNIQDIYRAHHIDRWQIVNVTRHQSLAEHSFNVAMIALEINKKLGHVYEKAYIPDLLMWALHHDLPEIATGDIASPLKALIREKDPELIERVESAMSPTYSELKEEFKGSYVAAVVKMADFLDGIRYLELYKNPHCKHAKETEFILIHKLVDFASKLDKEKFAGIDCWLATSTILAHDMREGKPTSIDSIMQGGDK